MAQEGLSLNGTRAGFWPSRCGGRSATEARPRPLSFLINKRAYDRVSLGGFIRRVCCGLVLLLTVGNVASGQTIRGSFTNGGTPVSTSTWKMSITSIVHGTGFAYTINGSWSVTNQLGKLNGSLVGTGAITFQCGGATVATSPSPTASGVNSGAFSQAVTMSAQAGTGYLWLHNAIVAIPPGAVGQQAADAYGDLQLEAEFWLSGGTNGSYYNIGQSGRQVDQVFVPAGETILYTYPTSDPSTIGVTRTYAAESRDANGFWFYQPTSVDPGNVATMTPGATSGSITPVTVPVANAGAGSVTPDAGSGSSGSGSQDKSISWLPTPLAPTDPVTEGTYKQGVVNSVTAGDIAAAAIVSSVNTQGAAIVAAVSASGGGGSGSGLDGLGQDAYNANPSTSTMSDDGSSAAADIAGDYPGGSQPSGPTIVDSAPNFAIVLPARMGGASFDLNPFRSDRFGPLASWFRAAMSWLVVVVFGKWASEKVAEWSRGSAPVHQAVGNTVAAGTGGQATALIAAGIMTAAFATFIVGMLGWLTSSFSITNVLSILGANPLAGGPSGALWMVDQLFPVSMIIAGAGARITWNLYASKVFMVCMTLVRFVVP